MRRKPVQRALKRVLDPVAAGVGLVVLSPLYAGLSVAVYLDSGRPIIFVSPTRGTSSSGRAAARSSASRACAT